MERKLIYITLGICSALGGMVPGAEVLKPYIEEQGVKLVQWAAGGLVAIITAGLTAWRAYIDQHESRNNQTPDNNETTPPTP